MAHEAIRAALGAVLTDMGVAEPSIRLERPRDPTHGDLATNVAMSLARELRRSPREIAAEIVERLDLEAAGVTSVEVAGPGFLNFRLSAGAVASILDEIVAADGDFGRSSTGADGGESNNHRS